MAIDNQLSGSEQQDNSTHESFRTPDEIAAQDSHTTASSLIPETELNEEVMSKKNRRVQKRLRLIWPPTKKKLLILLIIVVVLGIGGYLLYKHFDHKKESIKTVLIQSEKPVVKSDTVASSLTGLQVSPSVNKLPITAVMIENSLDARPQSGLAAAGVVFEALAEGGITRFMAVYQNTTPSTLSLGPVRSARPYYIQWELGFDADYAHVGGSPTALSDISSWNVKDLDQFYNSSAYTRITSREAPHNVYTSIGALNTLEDSKGYDSSSFTSWPREAAKPAKVPTATSINLTMSGPDYNPSYAYDASTNSYNRSEGGAPQIDANTNAQISPQVVVAMVVPWAQGAADGIGAYYSDYSTIGSGPVYVFQDGNVTIGQWTKTSNNSQIQFTTSSGKPLDLIPGQVWITAVATSSAVSYSK